MNDKEARVKYIRALERFLNSCIGALKNESFEYALFVSRAQKSLKTLQKVAPTRLDSTYTNALQNYANLVASLIEETQTPPEEKHKRLLKEANLLEKEKYRGYKKEKHKSKSFDDGY
jgi:hypothetical protein